MAQPSRKDALNLARSFIVTEADEDSEAEDFESDDKHYDQSQQQEEDLCRQKAESVHLRARNYDPFAEICDPPVVLPSPYAAPTPSSPNHDREMEAWVLLDKYLTSDSGQGGQVHAALEKLCVGAKWDDVWGRITGMEPGDEDAATAVRNALDSIKPTVPGPTLLSDRVDSAHLEDLEVGEGEELTEEQKELAEYLNKFSDSVMLEEYGIYYVQCRRGKESEIMQRIQRDIKRDRHPKCLVQAFASRKQGGLYVRVRSMLDANYVLAAYFRLIDGFLYSRQPVFSYAADNTRDSIAQKDDPGFTVPLLWKGPYLTMPIHHRITGMRKFPYTAKLCSFSARCLGNREEGDYSSECVVAFLPRLDLPQQKFKRVKKTHSSNPAVPATFTTPFPVSTTMSDIKSKFDFVSINTKAGYPIPLERTVPSKKRSVPSARRPRPSKVRIGSTPVLKFAEFHDIPPSSILARLVNMATRSMPAKADYLAGSSLDLLEFFETESTVLQLNIPLPSTWIFGLGEQAVTRKSELASELGLQSKDEGFIRDVVEINWRGGVLGRN
ncbi:hypothetical protein BT96DRAFT_944869 [Gymnopus androsaceus JB14]|uniref:Uncharacterized protein n=1 Tax=Gymnopus androsaceus JB14 TaxID=1447944 RepID=A0A6A4H306_9AGAR|nr:hypothetical protein BT96DRAFT_944869 [Gymnopus androsaceus JB14]